MRPKKLSSAKVQKFLSYLLAGDSKKAWLNTSSEIELTQAHRKSHLTNPALGSWFKKIYELHQKNFSPFKPTVELGSGGSQLKNFMPDLVTTDILPLPGLDAVVDALKMPYGDDAIGNLTMINVLHHLPRPLTFFSEANRALCVGGRLVFTEPYVSFVSYPIYKYIHHEPCEMRNNILELNQNSKALLDSNQAIPTQLMRKHFRDVSLAAPALKLREIKYHSSLIYFLSGGVNYKPLVPFWLWVLLERCDSVFCAVFGKFVASFFTVVYEKVETRKLDLTSHV